jgi:hypothetical protein
MLISFGYDSATDTESAFHYDGDAILNYTLTSSNREHLLSLDISMKGCLSKGVEMVTLGTLWCLVIKVRPLREGYLKVGNEQASWEAFTGTSYELTAFDGFRTLFVLNPDPSQDMYTLQEINP